MVAVKHPNCHVLISASDEAIILSREKLEAKYWQTAEIAESEGAPLLPLEHLEAEILVVSNRGHLLAFWRESNLYHSS